MNKENIIIQNLLQKYADHQISKEEYDKLLAYIKKHRATEDLELIMDRDWKKLSDEFPFSELKSEQLFQKIISNPVYAEPISVKSNARTFKLWRYVAGAVAAVAVIMMAVWMYSKSQRGSGSLHILTLVNDIPSGSNKATLTLANGKTINLSEAKTGVLIKGSMVTYNDGAAIGALADGEVDPAGSRIQTITTPKGGTYQITLSDGTRVWLNAASSLRYSASIYEQGLRRVSLDGEAYFEVAKDKAHPFVVSSRGQEVKVLGTHFNISSYSDEKSVKTTLLEGSVQVNSVLLKPDEQSVLENNKISVMPVDTEKIVAWKNGKFVFTSESIESIMKKLSRWYNVEVVYKGDFSDETFTGSISRYDNISRILEKITFTQAVHFKVEGRRVTVMP
ncbi:FecR family protein [Pedobacter africanus]|uniref:FecR family protein n=1 Tax=Pedobacter africanus TaxID=151894 RepID=A0A1W1Z7L7_9SPHI|nr:FecR family protein [Pedobacter africanus]SMC44403.1 FecR family protein [Pedobacter africanus]